MCTGAGAVGDGILAPSTNVLGSYFPSWMLCALGAVAVTVAVRKIFVLVGLDRSLPAPFLVYLAIIVACSLGAWLIWLG
jgi:YtcA family